jgi:hypothetical protein
MKKINSTYEHSIYKYVSKNILFVKFELACNVVYYDDTP